MDHPLAPFQLPESRGQGLEGKESSRKADESTPVKSLPNLPQIGPMTPQQNQASFDASSLTPVTQIMSCR